MNFSKEFSDKLNASANNTSPYSIDYENLLLVYFALVSKSQLCELEADCLENILEFAQLDDKLAILLNQIDNITYENLGYFEPEAIHHYHDEQATVLEFITKQQNKPSLIDYQTLLADYYTLAMRYEQSEVEIEYLGRILELAQTDDRLALLLNEIDQITYQELRLLEESNQTAEQTEQAREQIKRIVTAQARMMPQDSSWQNSPWQNRKCLSTGYIARISRLIVTNHVSWLVAGGVAASLLALLRGAALLGTHRFPSMPVVAISPTITPAAKAAELPKKQPIAASHPIQQKQPVIEVSTASQQPVPWEQATSEHWSEQAADPVADWHKLTVNTSRNILNNTSKSTSRSTLRKQTEPERAKLASLSETSNQVNLVQISQPASIEPNLRYRFTQSALVQPSNSLEIAPASTSAFSLFDQQPFPAPAAIPAKSSTRITSAYCDPLLLLAGQPQEQSAASVQWITEADLLLGTGATPCTNRSEISDE
jgi:hypothetical protein